MAADSVSAQPAVAERGHASVGARGQEARWAGAIGVHHDELVRHPELVEADVGREARRARGGRTA